MLQLEKGAEISPPTALGAYAHGPWQAMGGRGPWQLSRQLPAARLQLGHCVNSQPS
jgi:hypothetical protein